MHLPRSGPLEERTRLSGTDASTTTSEVASSASLLHHFGPPSLLFAGQEQQQLQTASSCIDVAAAAAAAARRPFRNEFAVLPPPRDVAPWLLLRPQAEDPKQAESAPSKPVPSSTLQRQRALVQPRVHSDALWMQSGCSRGGSGRACDGEECTRG
jgi:hypothetical protein